MKHKIAKSRARETQVRTGEPKKEASKLKKFRVTALLGDNYYVAGAATVFDVSGSSLKYPKLGSMNSDRDALQKDFYVIGDDMKRVLRGQLGFLDNKI